MLAPVPTENTAASIVDRDSVFTRRYDTQEERLAAIQSELEKRVTSLADDERWQDYLDTMAKFHRYSFSNQMLIAVQTNGQATRVAGFNKWKEMDRSVRKGEKAITILAPKIANIIKKDASGNPVIGDDGKPVKERRVVGFTTASVFDVSQTDGKPLPRSRWDQELSEEPPPGFKADLEQAISEAGYTVHYEPTGSAAAGYTDPSTKRVVVGPGSPANQVRTLAHELGHISCGHVDESPNAYHADRGAKETEAESVAYVLCRANGMSPQIGDNSGDYIAGWGGTDGEQVRKSAELVQKTVKGLLAGGLFRNADAAA